MISDALSGLKAAIAQAFSGGIWQRCSMHFTLAPALSAGVRNVLAQVSHRDEKQVAETVKLIFEQPDQASAKSFLVRLAPLMESRCPKVSQKLLKAEDDILAYKTFPKKHHCSIHSVNPLERHNREIRARPGWWVSSLIVFYVKACANIVDGHR